MLPQEKDYLIPRVPQEEVTVDEAAKEKEHTKQVLSTTALFILECSVALEAVPIT